MKMNKERTQIKIRREKRILGNKNAAIKPAITEKGKAHITAISNRCKRGNLTIFISGVFTLFRFLPNLYYKVLGNLSIAYLPD